VALELDVEKRDQRHLEDAARERQRIHPAERTFTSAHVRDQHVQQQAAGDDERVDEQRAQQVEAEAETTAPTSANTAYGASFMTQSMMIMTASLTPLKK
jgi:hypothetical protein